MKDLHDYRKSYQKGTLEEADLPANWFELFRDWFEQADRSEQVEEANAMHLATLGLDGFPKSRVVLLKSFSAQSLIFFTNYLSEKGKSIAANNKVGISFFWPALEKQVIFKGTAHQLEAEASDRYFYTRPVGSQKGAIVSNQSSVISSRDHLIQAMEALKDTEIKRPPHWGGYAVVPHSVEFWQGRDNRLHDRIRYQLLNEHWVLERLAP